MAKNMIKLPIGNDDTARKIGINGFNNTIAAGNCAKKYLPYRNALNSGKIYGASATTRSGTGTILNPPPEYPPVAFTGTDVLARMRRENVPPRESSPRRRKASETPPRVFPNASARTPQPTRALGAAAHRRTSWRITRAPVITDDDVIVNINVMID